MGVGLIAVVGLGFFLSSYLNPINTAIRDGNIATLMTYASSGTSENKIAAIEGFDQIESLKTNQKSGLVNSPEQAQVVDFLILKVQNDPNLEVKEAAIGVLGTVWNDKAINFLKSVKENPSQIQISGSSSQKSSYEQQLIQSSAGFSLSQIETAKSFA